MSVTMTALLRSWAVDPAVGAVLFDGAALSHSFRDLRAREGVAAAASNLVPAVARLDGGFLFRFFGAGLSYGVDRDDSPIARSRTCLPTSATLSAFPRAREEPVIRWRRVVARRRRSYGDAADRQRDRANRGQHGCLMLCAHVLPHWAANCSVSKSRSWILIE